MYCKHGQSKVASCTVAYQLPCCTPLVNVFAWDNNTVILLFVMHTLHYRHLYDERIDTLSLVICLHLSAQWGREGQHQVSVPHSDLSVCCATGCVTVCCETDINQTAVIDQFPKPFLLLYWKAHLKSVKSPCHGLQEVTCFWPNCTVTVRVSSPCVNSLNRTCVGSADEVCLFGLVTSKAHIRLCSDWFKMLSPLSSP